MNERIIIRLTEDGRHLPINSLSTDGVMLRNETDATPRGLVVEFGTAAAVLTRGPLSCGTIKVNSTRRPPASNSSGASALPRTAKPAWVIRVNASGRPSRFDPLRRPS